MNRRVVRATLMIGGTGAVIWLLWKLIGPRHHLDRPAIRVGNGGSLKVVTYGGEFSAVLGKTARQEAEGSAPLWFDVILSDQLKCEKGRYMALGVRVYYGTDRQLSFTAEGYFERHVLVTADNESDVVINGDTILIDRGKTVTMTKVELDRGLGTVTCSFKDPANMANVIEVRPRGIF